MCVDARLAFAYSTARGDQFCIHVLFDWLITSVAQAIINVEAEKQFQAKKKSKENEEEEEKRKKKSEAS